MYLANSEERAEGGDDVRRREALGALEVDAEHPDVVRAATKTLAVSDAKAIDVCDDCDVLRRG